MRTLGRRLAVSLAGLAIAAGCTWVPLTEGGEQVRVLGARASAGCEVLGRTTAQTSERVLLFARTERKVREEVTSLARNDAADMGGNAIAPIGPLERGRQVFEIYRCQP